MWKLVILLLPFWFLSLHLFAFPVDVRPQPPVSDPVLPTEKEPILPSTSSLKPAHSPDSGIRVVHHQDLNKKILISLVLSASLLGGLLLLLSCIWIYRLNRQKNLGTNSNKSSDALEGISLGPLLDKFPSARSSDKKGSIAVIEFPMLVAATRNFHEDNVLGEGGLGCVYKAKFGDNVYAAVKRLHGRCKDVDRELENEVDLLCKIRHQNIVALLGYCVYNETQFLVYEMMQNGSLESQLHGASHGSKLTWHLRMKIALDIARGLEYLHERLNPPVIHRDLKSSNILLDSNFNAKISDFGLAISVGNSNKSSSVKLSGTLGYVAPEYLLDGKLTDKSDVYAFGVVLLELLMGRKPVEKIGESHFQSIVTWAMPQLTDRDKLPNIVDPVIRNTMDPKHLYQVAAVAVLCVQPEPSYRPLITDVLHSFIPLVAVELGGSLKVLTDVNSPKCT